LHFNALPTTPALLFLICSESSSEIKRVNRPGDTDVRNANARRRHKASNRGGFTTAARVRFGSPRFPAKGAAALPLKADAAVADRRVCFGPIVLQKSKVAGPRFFRENKKQETIADSYDLNRVTEVACEFKLRR
jgi:hypothetical protein